MEGKSLILAHCQNMPQRGGLLGVGRTESG